MTGNVAHWFGMSAATVVLLICFASVALAMQPQQLIEVDVDGPGRVFEGIGGLSAGASSRLLPDYPEPQFLEGEGFVALLGLCATVNPSYWLKLKHDGSWELKAAEDTLASGNTDFGPNRWAKLRMQMKGREITAWIDDKQVARVEDGRYAQGQAGFGSGWNFACFDNLLIKPLDPAGAIGLH